MTITVERGKLLSLLNGSVRTTWENRPLTHLTGDLIKARMKVKDRATLVGSMSGGDESHTVTAWEVPGIGRATLIIKRETLAALAPPRPRYVPPARASLFDP